jgi:SAM-dependent methyltransferase
MPEQPSDYRLYGDLAEWWPLISPAEEYAEDAAFAAGLFGLADGPVRDVLELGSGGGSNASHLTDRFAFTLVDLSDGMLAVSRQLNPDSAHVQGDMRTIRLGRTFDAVFVHDALDYMTSEDDLRQVVATAFEHCRPGGVAVFMPDNITETFEPATGCGGGDGADGRAARFLDWSWDPDPADTWTQTDYVYMLRRPGEPVHVVQESHRLGLFPRDTWLSLLTSAGFHPQGLTEETSQYRWPRDVFTGVRPGG